MSFWDKLVTSLGEDPNAYDNYVKDNSVIITQAEQDYAKQVGPAGYINSLFKPMDPNLSNAIQEELAGDPRVSATPVKVTTPVSNYVGSASVPVRKVVSAAPSSHFTYVDAPYAQQYGMDKSTAYQEALANTAHQREVDDLKAAGLNPVLSANGGSGASVFGGTPYMVSTSAAGTSRSYGSSKSSKNDKVDWSNILKQGSRIIGGVVSLFGHPAVGSAISSVGSAAGNLADALSD